MNHFVGKQDNERVVRGMASPNERNPWLKHIDEESQKADDEPPGTGRGIDRISRLTNPTHLPLAVSTATALRRNGVARRKVNGHLNTTAHLAGSQDNGHVIVLSGKVSRRSLSPRTRVFRKKFYPDVADRQWNDWRWQSQHRIRKLEQFEQIVTLSSDEREALIQGGTM